MNKSDKTRLPTVAVIVVNWNTYLYTKSCLDQASRLSYDSYQVILVDNGSSDGSGDRLSVEYPEVVFLKNTRNLGFTGGNNKGIEFALVQGFTYIFLLNNDTYFETEFLNILVDHLESNPHTGAVQPLIYEANGEQNVWHAGGMFNRFTGSTKSIKSIVHLEKAYQSAWLTGCAFLIRSEVVRKIGSLKSSYFAYFEDVDWSFRVRRAGYALEIVPKAILHHEVSASTKSKIKQKEGYLNPAAHYLNVRNSFLLLKSGPTDLIKVTAWPYQVVKATAVLIYFLLRFRFKKLHAAADGLRDGLRHSPESETPPDISCYL